MALRAVPVLALVLFCCLTTAAAQLVYTGNASFINSFDKVGNVVQLPGANLSLITAGEVYGLNIAGQSAVLINLAPCTILEPHTHPHSEFAFTVYGTVMHSTPYNNLTLFNLTANTGEAATRGFGVFPSNQLHVTYNPTCEPAQVLSVFNTPFPNLNFYPYAESFLPKDVIGAFFKGELTAGDLAKPLGTAELVGCECPAAGKNRRRFRM